MNIALFASGTGSNVKNILDYFETKSSVNVALVASNNIHSGALIHAKNHHVDQLLFNKQELLDVKKIQHVINEKKIQLIVLAGFLLKIPSQLIDDFNGKIINLHPALLPKYGGKGMYGDHVHKAVF